MRYYLDKLIDERKTSVNCISANTGVSESVLRKMLENSNFYASLEDLEKLANFFDCDLEDLVKLKPGAARPKEESKLDAIIEIVGAIQGNLKGSMGSHQVSFEKTQTGIADASQSSFGNAIGQAITRVLLESALDGIRNKLTLLSQQSPFPVGRVPFCFFMPLEVYGNKLMNKYPKQEIDNIYEVRRIFDNFLTARSKARKKICEKVEDILSNREKPANSGDMVIFTGGYSSVVEELLEYLIKKINPFILISLGAEGTATQYEGILLWQKLKSLEYEKVKIIGPDEFTKSGFRDAIIFFLRKYIDPPNKRYDVRAIFGYESIRADGSSLITSKEFKVAINALETLKDSEGLRGFELNLRTYFVGEAYKIMSPGDDICFEMDERYICRIPCSMIDYLVTEHDAHTKLEPERFEVSCCKENWIETLEGMYRSSKI